MSRWTSELLSKKEVGICFRICDEMSWHELFVLRTGWCGWAGFGPATGLFGKRMQACFAMWKIYRKVSCLLAFLQRRLNGLLSWHMLHHLVAVWRYVLQWLDWFDSSLLDVDGCATLCIAAPGSRDLLWALMDDELCGCSSIINIWWWLDRSLSYMRRSMTKMRTWLSAFCIDKVWNLALVLYAIPGRLLQSFFPLCLFKSTPPSVHLLFVNLLQRPCRGWDV